MSYNLKLTKFKPNNNNNTAKKLYKNFKKFCLIFVTNNIFSDYFVVRPDQMINT